MPAPLLLPLAGATGRGIVTLAAVVEVVVVVGEGEGDLARLSSGRLTGGVSWSLDGGDGCVTG